MKWESVDRIHLALNGNLRWSSHKIAIFKVAAKSRDVATRKAGPRRVKTAQNSFRIKVSNAVLFD